MNGTIKYRRRRGTRAGQAIAELVVGLIALLVIIMCMLQIQSLALTHTQTLNAARAQAGADAVISSYVLRNEMPPWVNNISSGRDSIRYSQDDSKLTGNPGYVTDGIVARAKPSDLAHYVPGNELSAAASSGGLMNELYLTHGRQQTAVGIFPVIKSLVYGTDTIQMQGDAWLSWTHIENVK